MRSFRDAKGTEWIASFEREEGGDYKGRYALALAPASGKEGAARLSEVRWNSPKTAERTLATMSLFELRRRLRSARSRMKAG